MEPLADSSDAQCQVQFVTKLEEQWRITEAPIQLPTRLTRFGLSEVVNHLLNASPPRPFDFLLQGELLRGPLAKSLARLGLSGEAAVTLEYIELVPPPQPEHSCAHPDWITSVGPHPDAGHLLTGCYDHAAYVWDSTGKRIAELRGHMAPVKGVAWLSAAASGALRAVSVSKDHTVRTWQVESGAVRCEAVGASHTGSVECVSSNPVASLFCSGSWDGSIQIWSAAEQQPAPAARPSKRIKGGAGTEVANGADEGGTKAPSAELEPEASLDGHHDCVTSVCWPTANLLYSASLDGSVREWNIEAATCSAQLSGQKAVLCVSVSLLNTTIASGHSDHTLRLWDTRLQQASLKCSLPHKAWVSAVAWSGSNPYLLLSSCHDGGVRLWDIRSTVPLHQLPPHTDKALCAAWDGADRVVSGGADAQLRIAQIRAAEPL